MSHKEGIKSLITRYNRHLQKLKEQKASFGLYTPPHILTEIEDTEIEIEKLQTQLNDAKNRIEANPEDRIVPANFHENSPTGDQGIINSIFDVALSYAGEDRYYVKQVAEILRDSAINVFYDEFEEANLWGKNLYTYLQEIYRDHARYTIMFCSKSYATKMWTTHERESAQERAFRENSEYILPARLDDTEIPGLPITVAYIDLREKTPYEFCELIGKKLHKKILKKEQVNRTLHEAVNKTLEEEQALSNAELESRNRFWDTYYEHMQSLDKETLFLYQKKNSVLYLETYGVSVQEIKRHLSFLGFYEGADDNDFTPEFVEAVRKFQSLSNMRHIDGMIGELTLKELEERVKDKLSRK